MLIKIFRYYKQMVTDGVPDAVAAEMVYLKFDIVPEQAAKLLYNWAASRKFYLEFAKKYLVWQLHRLGMPAAKIAEYAEISRQAVYKSIKRDPFYYNPDDGLIYYKRLVK